MEKFEQYKNNKENSAKDAEHLLNDLKLVGPEKPIGFLPVDTLIKICKIDPERIKEELEWRGLKTIIMNKRESGVPNGVLYVYDENSLKLLLDKNRTILENAGWPTNPESFVRHLKNIVGYGTDLFDLIADAFGDKTNFHRKKKTTLNSTKHIDPSKTE